MPGSFEETTIYCLVLDLSVISSMPYLVELDVSHNQIQSLRDITPPNNLKVSHAFESRIFVRGLIYCNIESWVFQNGILPW